MISKQTKYYLFSTVLGVILLTGCGGSSNNTTTPEENTTTTLPSTESDINITEPYQTEKIAISGTTSLNLSIDVQTSTPKDLYIVFSNIDTTYRTSVDITHSNKIITPLAKKNTRLSSSSHILPPPTHIQTFNQHLLNFPTLTNIVKNEKSEGDTQTFYLEAYADSGSTNATLKKVVLDIDTEFGKKTLNIWVSDDSFDDGNGCEKSTCVTQDMIDALADTFLQSGTSNDIYDWVTNIFGEEWGSNAEEKYSYLIEETNEINLLFTDLDNDNSINGGVIGYFYAKDNYKKAYFSGSNEMIMFYVDSVLFAVSDGNNWSIEDFWPKETISTLAHEFQHMIQFYQKAVLRSPSGDSLDTWLNEMLSETIEEVISTKIKHDGPRGVDYTDGSAGEPNNPNGRYPDFNAYNTLSLTSWRDLYADYSKVNAFGAYLTRNYGVGILHDIMQSDYIHEDAVVYAVNRTPNGEGKTFNDLLQEWGVAVMLSSIENPEDLPTYNAGDFIESSFGDTTYDLGSINFFNYDPQPTIYTTGGTIEPQGNYYYLIGTGVSGKIDVNITLNGTTEATLIAK